MALTAGVLFACWGPPAAAQQPPATVAAAERLAAAGRYAEAADSLLVHLASHPGDGGVRWRAAQLIHWSGDPRAAAAHYRTALAIVADDPWLRLEYAELLLALGRVRQAREVALPLLEGGGAPDGARSRALALLGTAAYWDGDLPEAIRHLEAALALDAGQDAAARQLREIRLATRPWSRLALHGLEDDQPYRRAHAELQGGAFVTPLWAAGVEAVPRVLDADAKSAAGEARATLSGFLPRARLELAVALGSAWQGGEAATSDWVGRAGAGLRLPGEFTLAARAERTRYLWTRASADTLLMVDAIEAALDRADAPGWAGEAVLRRESFPDGNPVTTAYVWILAPLAPVFRAGWASSWQDAEESRWSPLQERYIPYFTPEEQGVHSVLAEVRAPLGGATLRLNGSYAVSGTERAPARPPHLPGHVPGAPAVVFQERSYTPWSALVVLEVPVGDALELYVEAERRETAFYALTRGSVAALFRFGGPPGP